MCKNIRKKDIKSMQNGKRAVERATPQTIVIKSLDISMKEGNG